VTDGVGKITNPVACRTTRHQTTRTRTRTSAKADPDGDGWGWENHRSCIVKDDDDKDDDDGDDGDGDGDGDGDDKDKDGDDKRKVDGVIFKQDFNDVDTGLYQGDQLNDGWQSPLWHIGFDQGNVKIVNSGTARAKAMEVTYAAGAFGAASGTAFLSSVQFTMGLPKSYDELYLSYDIYFDDDFTFVKGGKLPGLCGSDVNAAPSTGCNTGGGFPSGYDGWSARTMWRQNTGLCLIVRARKTAYSRHGSTVKKCLAATTIYSAKLLPWGLTFFTSVRSLAAMMRHGHLRRIKPFFSITLSCRPNPLTDRFTLLASVLK